MNNATDKLYYDFLNTPHKSEKLMLLANTLYLAELQKRGIKAMYGKHGELCLNIDELRATFDEELSIKR